MTSKINALTGSGGVAIDGDASGIIELQSNGTKVAEVSAAGVLSANSGYGSVAPVYGVRAWVSFNGTGTVAIRGSANVSSITDNGTGDYTLNFTTNMPDTNYAATLTTTDTNAAGTNLVAGLINVKATSSVRVWTFYIGQSVNRTFYDVDDVNVMVTR